MNAPREDGSFTPGASEGGVLGRIDWCESPFAVGWAMQPIAPDERLSVELVVDGVPVTQSVADELRGDVREAGIGDGRYGFRIPLPHGCRDGAMHRIDVRVAGTSLLLKGGRVKLFDQSTSNRPPLDLKVDVNVEQRSVDGWLDKCEQEGLAGWALRTSDVSAVEVELVIDGVVVDRVVANQERADLSAAHIGTGRHGFRFVPPENFFDGRAHEVGVREVSTGEWLKGCPIVLVLHAGHLRNLPGAHKALQKPMSEPFRVVALIAAYNEGDIISAVIGHLIKNGIDVYLMDNHSTDDTVEQAKPWLGRGLMQIESFPCDAPSDSPLRGQFAWTAILSRKQELAREIRADWFIHHDADEIREGPWPGVNLKDAIQWVDTLGYNCIDFRAFNFPPVDNGFTQGNDPRTYFRFCEPVAEFDKLQLKCWKATGTPVSLCNSGGHDAEFPGRRIFPIPFLLRHYPIRSQTHGVRKVFSDRRPRLIETEQSKGWHIQYDQVEDETHNFLKNPEALSSFDLDRIRLELMMPYKATRELAERLEGLDAELIRARTQQRDTAQALAAFRQHAEALEREREKLQQRIASLDAESAALEARLVDGECGLAEHPQHSAALEQARQDLDERYRALNHDIAGVENTRSPDWN
jgi:hypothetical protein